MFHLPYHVYVVASCRSVSAEFICCFHCLWACLCGLTAVYMLQGLLIITASTIYQYCRSIASTIDQYRYCIQVLWIIAQPNPMCERPTRYIKSESLFLMTLNPIHVSTYTIPCVPLNIIKWSKGIELGSPPLPYSSAIFYS